MRILVATDAWRPQVNGVVRTLSALARAARGLGAEIDFLSPEGFWSVPMPSYPQLRLALPSPGAIAARIEAAKPDAIHIATEGPIGHLTRAYCVRRRRRFTTSYTTRFPEYIAARYPVPPAGPMRCCAGSMRRPPSRWSRRPRSTTSCASAISPISACGRAASTRTCSGPTAPLRSISRGPSLSRWDGWRWRKISTPSSRSIYRGRSSSSAAARSSTS